MEDLGRILMTSRTRRAAVAVALAVAAPRAVEAQEAALRAVVPESPRGSSRPPRRPLQHPQRPSGNA